jgi:aspartyl-tRNA(Asn)/glutamyl-tRNA(Gln) amidotransferase subunit A
MSNRDIQTTVSAALGRIEERNIDLHAFITVLHDEVLSAARDLEIRSEARADPLGMHGTIVAVKDNIDVVASSTTCGVGGRHTRIAMRDAAVVSQLRAAGALVVGKLNMHEGALGTDSANPHYGHVGNPSAPELTPGGSSGGSAAAVAAGLCDMALGTDTLGSIRIPASFCDVVGFKPSRGRVSNHGLVMLWDQFDVIGPIARTVNEVVTAAAVMLGRPIDTVRAQPRVTFFGNLVELGVHHHVIERTSSAMEAAGNLAAISTTTSLDPERVTRARRAAFTLAQLGAVQTFGADLENQPDGMSPEFQALLRFGAALSPERVASALGEVAHAVREFERLFDDTDIIMCPTAPSIPFPRGTRPPNNVVDLTMPWSVIGAPAITIPTSRPSNTPPVGVQIVGRPGDDDLVLRFAQRLTSDLA